LNEASLELLLLYAHTGKRRDAIAGLAMRPREGASDHDVLSVAAIYAALGDHDHAIAVLEKGVGARTALAFVFADPRLDPLRYDPRFHQLLRRINLPRDSTCQCAASGLRERPSRYLHLRTGNFNPS